MFLQHFASRKWVFRKFFSISESSDMVGMTFVSNGNLPTVSPSPSGPTQPAKESDTPSTSTSKPPQTNEDSKTCLVGKLDGLSQTEVNALIIHKLECIETRVADIETLINTLKARPAVPEHLPEVKVFPLSGIHDIESFDEDISGLDGYRGVLYNVLNSLGGKDACEQV